MTERPNAGISAPTLVVLFGALTGLGGIFIDAVIAHGLFWDNDPYWTYWITKTFLIMTIYMVGISLLGIGMWQGVAITAVHTVVLTAYYDWFAPVGLPQEPEWLDMNHLWITGVPAHFLAIWAGYLGAFWIWRRNGLPERLNNAEAKSSLWLALAGSILILAIDGLVTHALIFHAFPGFTYFIQHLLITVVFLLAWNAAVGFDTTGKLVGGLVLSLIWLGYGMYLGPTGLPQEVRYLGYEDLWMRAWPGALVACVGGIFLARAFIKPKVQVAVAILALLTLPGTSRAAGLQASASTSGACMRIVGPDPVDMTHSVPGSGSIDINVTEKGNRWSHVQNTDDVSVVAHWTEGNDQWQVEISKPMPRHPLGKYTVWNGVVFRHEMHGHTGIGTPKLPLVKPDIALWGWARVLHNGQEISRMSPAHAMVMKDGPMQGIMLEVDTEEKGLVGVPDGYLTVMWHEVGTLKMPDEAEQQRKIIGWTVLILIPIGLWFLAARTGPRPVV